MVSKPSLRRLYKIWHLPLFFLPPKRIFSLFSENIVRLDVWAITLTRVLFGQVYSQISSVVFPIVLSASVFINSGNLPILTVQRFRLC